VLLLLRFRRSTGDERQQLKWFSVGAVLLAAGVVAGLLLADELASAVRPTAGAFVVEILSVTGLIALPVTTGIGILKYRLYHIDHLINRALVYAALTAILAGLYSASIRLFQALFIAFTGNQSDAALVLTTLVLATTFTPIKSRLETIAGTRLGQRDPHDTGRRTDERGAHGYDESTLARELHTLADRVASVEAAIDGLMHERDRSGWTDTTRPRKKPREVRSEPARTGEPVRTIGSRHR